jgi:hypothetical protein
MESITLFIGKIPTDTRINELKAFVESAVSLSLRLRSGLRYKICKAEIIRNVDELTMEIEFHGLVTIKPPAIADQIIERLNSKDFKGNSVVVRRYYERNNPSDRLNQGNDSVLQLGGKRIRDRRTQVSVDFDREKSELMSYKLEQSD